MEWSNPRKTLSINVSDINGSKHTIAEDVWNKKRVETLKKYDYHCSFCGGKFIKYLIGYCDEPEKDNKDNMEICCRSCYLVTHINLGFNHEMSLYYSKMGQLDINRKTTDFIIDNDRIPYPSEIDPDVKVVPLSIMELCNILTSSTNFIKVLPIYSRIRIFFTQMFNISFLNAIKFKTKSLFKDDDDLEPDIPVINKPPKIKFKKQDDNIIKIFFEVYNDTNTIYQHVSATN